MSLNVYDVRSNNYDDIKEGEKRQINKIVREIDGIKYVEYTYITKLKGGKIHKQIVKTKYTNKKKETPNIFDLQQNNPNNAEIKHEKRPSKILCTDR
jgi:hypothetical protein